MRVSKVGPACRAVMGNMGYRLESLKSLVESSTSTKFQLLDVEADFSVVGSGQTVSIVGPTCRAVLRNI